MSGHRDIEYEEQQARLAAYEARQERMERFVGGLSAEEVAAMVQCQNDLTEMEDSDS